MTETIESQAPTPASREAVWALLADASTWSRWGSWSAVDVEGGGPQGPGAIRVLVRRPFRVRERITTWEPARRMGYVLLDGMRAEGYRATVTLEDGQDGGTVVRWTATYDRAGPVTRFILSRAVQDACTRLARAAAA
jgi:carbon monoxide dehydrogenase subunit G